MTTNSRLAEKLRRRQLYLLRHQASFRAEIDRYLTSLGKAIAANIVTVSPSAPAREAYRTQRVDRLIEEVSATIAGTYRDINRFSLSELSGLAEVESLFLLNSVNELFDRRLTNIALDASEAVALVKSTLMTGSPMKDWWATQSAATQTRFAQEMRMGILSGASDAELIARVRGTPRMNYTDGMMEASKRKARILVRGASSAVVGAQRAKSVADNPDIFNAVQQISVLDGRTSPICIACAGKCWRVPGYKPIGHAIAYNGGCPRHPNCRSVIIPVIREERGGGPAEDVSFDAFLAGQPASMVDELLGRGRAQLYRDGKITLSDLVDQHARPLTLEELRKIS